MYRKIHQIIVLWIIGISSSSLGADWAIEPPINVHDYDHWAFSKLVRPRLPQVVDRGWGRNPIDLFVIARLEEEKLLPLPEVDRRTLYRRAKFDLHGLPPDPDKVDRFVHDPRPDAYERLIDELLSAPEYGERWGQHWLDLARFAETDGFEHDKVRPAAWKYRDWVINALNADLPYDEFVRLQVAGDELKPNQPAAAIATGFALCGPDMPDINLREERAHMVLNEMTSTVASAFTALQFGCAQCHDHKYDPISQADFYRLRAFFDNTDIFKPSKHGRTLFEVSSKTDPSYLMVRGDFRSPGMQLEHAYPRISNPENDRPPSTFRTATTSGRRAALAHWLTRPDHPQTLRVIVNRLWQHHFGHGLVRTPSDFGLMGESPTHPELLDWLATELPRQGWSLKAMHRLMMTSTAYRLASGPACRGWTSKQTDIARQRWRELSESDPYDEFLGHQQRRRLEGEAIRDTMLAVGSQLSQRRGGPGVMPPLPREIVATLLRNQWKVSSDPVDHHRRSIYLFVRRNLRYPIFEAFDRPDTNASCALRGQSTTAPQSLLLFNSKLSYDCAVQFASAIHSAAGSDPVDQVILCYRRALGREPTTEETQLACDFISKSVESGLIDLCLAMFNLNEFIYID